MECLRVPESGSHQDVSSDDPFAHCLCRGKERRMKRLVFEKPIRCSDAFLKGSRSMSSYLLPSLVVLVLFAEPLLAQQPVSSLSNLASQVEKGDHIEVTSSDGRIMKGRYESVVDSSLRMRLSGRTQEISGATITGIKKRRPDSNLNGTLIGLAAGVGAAAVATNITCGSNDSECSAIAVVVFVPIFAGGGAGVGALIDQLTHKYDPIYVSQTTGGLRLRLSPLVSHDKKGVRLTMSF